MLLFPRKPPPLTLIPAGPVDAALLPALGAELGAHAGLQWHVGAPLALRDEWRDAETGVYRSGDIVDALIASGGAEGESGRKGWRLAIAEADLCASGVGPVFGEAVNGGCCAVITLAPLRRGSGADPDVFRGRLLTEALHELGHLGGADHCGRASCVMYPSLNIADTDRKGTSFCPGCRHSLKWRGLRKT